jgi:hypothetical protein
LLPSNISETNQSVCVCVRARARIKRRWEELTEAVKGPLEETRFAVWFCSLTFMDLTVKLGFWKKHLFLSLDSNINTSLNLLDEDKIRWSLHIMVDILLIVAISSQVLASLILQYIYIERERGEGGDHRKNWQAPERNG